MRIRASIHFYSRPCGRGDGVIGVRRRLVEDFYSRPCGRGDAVRRERSGSDGKISTHAPAGGATDGRARKCVQIFADFYSRPCGRGDLFAQGTDGSWNISTHAPAGGATVHVPLIDVPLTISTHAPAGGATVCLLRHYGVSKFLLTPLREGRRYGTDDLI